MWTGVTVIAHPLAREIREVWEIEKSPIKKRRRNWRVVKNVINRPGCYMMGGVMYMHPDLISKLRLASSPPENVGQRGS